MRKVRLVGLASVEVSLARGPRVERYDLLGGEGIAHTLQFTYIHTLKFVVVRGMRLCGNIAADTPMTGWNISDTKEDNEGSKSANSRREDLLYCVNCSLV